MIDIDNFKFINDTYGHTIGDEALRQIAMRLTEVSDINFTPYRFAGDEFIVIAKGTKDSLYEDEAKRCISIFSDIFDLSGIKHNIHGEYWNCNVSTRYRGFCFFGCICGLCYV